MKTPHRAKRRFRSIFAIFLTGWIAATAAFAKPQLIIDADTANEIDDPYAILRMIWQDEFEIVGLNATQWFHRRSGDQTVYQSQQLNQEILRLADRNEITAYVGTNDVFGNWWGGEQPMDSPAAQNIIARARALPEGEKLRVVCLGAFTNLASALALAPDIASRIAAYVIGYRYDFEHDIWSKRQFNVQRDYTASEYLLNQPELELHVMSVTLAESIKFQKQHAFEQLAKMGDLGAFLTHRWNMNGASRNRPAWTMWDLALVSAMIRPEMATEKQVTTPPENTRRDVWIYDSIDAEAIMADFWEVALDPPSSPPFPSAFSTYKEVGDVELKLHIFNPLAHHRSDSRPAIVLFFGGGWNGGGASHLYPQAKYLSDRGMVAITVEYRTKSAHDTDPRPCVRDGKSAMRWVRSHAAELGIDPDRIAAGGGSAGGHIAAATALLDGFNETTDDLAIDCRPNALVLFNPVFDNGPGGYGHDRVGEYWESFSPLHNIKTGAPPTVVFFGTNDDLVPVATAEDFRERMQAVGARCDLHLYEGQGHGFFNAKYPVYFQKTMVAAAAFLTSLGYLDSTIPKEPAAQNAENRDISAFSKRYLNGISPDRVVPQI